MIPVIETQEQFDALTRDELCAYLSEFIKKNGEDSHPDSVMDHFLYALSPDLYILYADQSIDWDDQGKYQHGTACFVINDIEYYWPVSRSGSYYTDWYYSNNSDVKSFDPLDAQVIAMYYQSFGCMGELEGAMIMTLREFNNLPDSVYLYEALGKHSEVEANFAANTEIVSRDPEAIKVVEKIFGRHCLGVNLLES